MKEQKGKMNNKTKLNPIFLSYRNFEKGKNHQILMNKLEKQISFPLQGPHEKNEEYSIRMKEYNNTINGDYQ